MLFTYSQKSLFLLTTVLHSSYEHLDVVRYLVNECHCELDLKMKNRSGITALHYACK